MSATRSGGRAPADAAPAARRSVSHAIEDRFVDPAPPCLAPALFRPRTLLNWLTGPYAAETFVLVIVSKVALVIISGSP
jgi:hypothetical protein